MNAIPQKMMGVVLPGNSTVEFREYDVPEPGYGQVLLKVKASSICGSDIRAIYREHLGTGPEAYQGVISGHEPLNQNSIAEPGSTNKRPPKVSFRADVYCNSTTASSPKSQ